VKRDGRRGALMYKGQKAIGKYRKKGRGGKNQK